jgi:DNA-binding NtrC family response regulator
MGAADRADPLCASGSELCTMPSPVTTTPLQPTLLVVEDDGALLGALQAAFHALLPPAWQLVTCSYAEAALQVLERTPVTAVLADHNLPNMSGLELLSIVAARWPATIRALMCADLTICKHVVATTPGGVALLEKPFSLSELQDWLATAVSFTTTQAG